MNKRTSLGREDSSIPWLEQYIMSNRLTKSLVAGLLGNLQYRTEFPDIWGNILDCGLTSGPKLRPWNCWLFLEIGQGIHGGFDPRQQDLLCEAWCYSQRTRRGCCCCSLRTERMKPSLACVPVAGTRAYTIYFTHPCGVQDLQTVRSNLFC